MNRKICKHCATPESCPYVCPQQIKKKHPVKSFVMEVVYLTILLIPEILLKRLTKVRIKRALIKQLNAMPPEMQLFYYKPNQVMSGKTTERDLTEKFNKMIDNNEEYQ